MRSSFVRKAGPRRGAGTRPGTRPGRLGQALVSTGTADLDRALGGGLPLGCLLLMVDNSSSTISPVDDSAQEELPAQSIPDHLRIAWQYRRYLGGTSNAANSIEPSRPSALQMTSSATSSFADNVVNTSLPDAPAETCHTASDTPAICQTAKEAWCHPLDLSRRIPFASLETAFTVSHHGAGLSEDDAHADVARRAVTDVACQNRNADDLACHDINAADVATHSAPEGSEAERSGVADSKEHVLLNSGSNAFAIPNQRKMGAGAAADLSTDQAANHVHHEGSCASAALSAEVPFSDTAVMTAGNHVLSDTGSEVNNVNTSFQGAVDFAARLTLSNTSVITSPLPARRLAVQSLGWDYCMHPPEAGSSPPAIAAALGFPLDQQAAGKALHAGLLAPVSSRVITQVHAPAAPQPRHSANVEPTAAVTSEAAAVAAQPLPATPATSLADPATAAAIAPQSAATTTTQSIVTLPTPAAEAAAAATAAAATAAAAKATTTSLAAAANRALLQEAFALKAAARRGPCAVVATLAAGRLGDDVTLRLQHVADAVVVVTHLHPDDPLRRILPDAVSCRGLLRVVKLPGMGAVAVPEADGQLLLIRRHRRHLTLQPVDVDPDIVDPLASGQPGAPAAGADVSAAVQEEAEELDDDESDSVNTIGGSATGRAGMLCGAGRPSAAPSVYDF